MASRRLFSLDIIDSDSFIDMPVSARMLYIDLGIRADDDGFISSPQSIIRATGAARDDLRVLGSKGLIIEFDTGLLVITHWRMHNSIRKDRYKPTIFKDEFNLLSIYDGTTYILGNQLATNWQPTVALSKGKISKDKISQRLLADGLRDSGFDLFWKTYPRKVKKAEAQTAWIKHKADRPPIDEIVTTIEAWSKADDWTKDNGQFIPYPASWINSRRWEDELPLIPETEDEEIKRIFG